MLDFIHEYRFMRSCFRVGHLQIHAMQMNNWKSARLNVYLCAVPYVHVFFFQNFELLGHIPVLEIINESKNYFILWIILEE